MWVGFLILIQGNDCFNFLHTIVASYEILFTIIVIIWRFQLAYEKIIIYIFFLGAKNLTV